MSEIIYKCKSINNKNVREGELVILRKSEKDELCFEFGENEINLKKRFYNNKTDFENDFKALEKLKQSKEIKKIKEEPEIIEEDSENKDSFKIDKTKKSKYSEY